MTKHLENIKILALHCTMSRFTSQSNVFVKLHNEEIDLHFKESLTVLVHVVVDLFNMTLQNESNLDLHFII